MDCGDCRGAIPLAERDMTPCPIGKTRRIRATRRTMTHLVCNQQLSDIPSPASAPKAGQ